MRRATFWDGMRICRLEPIATSKRVRKAAPPRQRFSLAVSSSKENPRASQPRTRKGKRTAILRSDLCFAAFSIVWLMGWVPSTGRFPSEEVFYVVDNFPRGACRMHNPAKFAAVPHTMSKPACELLHFAHTIVQAGLKNLPIVARQ